MRIAIDASSVVNERGGIQTYIRELVPALLAIDRENAYTLCYRLSRIRRRSRFMNLTAPNCRVKLIQEPFNLFFARSMDVFHGLGSRIPRYRHCALIATLHDLFALVCPHGSESFQATKRSRYADISERGTLVICVSENTCRDAETHLGIPKSRLRVIPHGVSRRFRVMDEASCRAVRAAHNLPPRFVLSVGAVCRRKNQVGGIRAFSRAAVRLPDLHLVLVGRPSRLSPEVRAVAEASPVAERIHFVDWVADSDLPALYTAASVFLFPSLYEGFGLPVLEAMACGVPVVASNRSSVPEVVGEAGLLVDPEDEEAIGEALISVVTDARCSEMLRAKGLAHARKFTWERTARETLEAYKDAARGT